MTSTSVGQAGGGATTSCTQNHHGGTSGVTGRHQQAHRKKILVEQRPTGCDRQGNQQRLNSIHFAQKMSCAPNSKLHRPAFALNHQQHAPCGSLSPVQEETHAAATVVYDYVPAAARACRSGRTGDRGPGCLPQGRIAMTTIPGRGP